ncbi:hypothetical protein ACT6QH_04280 [Xanthobacter sp. TB0139]|uniref:hypothetical protein n=1 Tax=Xanthobacter sp. TB0139 TaxID=3459178 RepID=UPI00403949FC
MRSADDVADITPEQDESGFSGLLGGLLPRRRSKEAEDSSPLHTEPSFEADSAGDEPHLPFPELSSPPPSSQGHVGNEPMRGRAMAQRVEERRFEDGRYEERIYEEHRFEGDLKALKNVGDDRVAPNKPAPNVPQNEVDHSQLEHHSDSISPSLKDPSFAPTVHEGRAEQGDELKRPVRSDVSLQRPSRGPAAHISSVPYPELSDPMLPFMEEAGPEDEFSESLEERIRRLKAQDQATGSSNEPGPPNEYVPLRYRHVPHEESSTTGVASGDMEPDDFPAIVRPVDAPVSPVHEAKQDGSLEEQSHLFENTPPADIWNGDRQEDNEMTGEQDTSPAMAPSDFTSPSAVESAPANYNSNIASDPSQEGMSPPHFERSSEPQEGPDMDTSARPRRFGPFTEPVVEEYDLPSLDSARLAEVRGSARPLGWGEDSPPRPAPRQGGYWDAEARPELMPRPTQPHMRYGVDPLDTVQAESHAYAHSLQPPRTDMRMSGQGVLPVLSRDDIHRLQAALYELSECQRLMADILEEKKT